jgi:hypothetical protein
VFELGIGVIRQCDDWVVDYSPDPILGNLSLFENVQGVETEEEGLPAHLSSLVRAGYDRATPLDAQRQMGFSTQISERGMHAAGSALIE